MKGTLYEVNKGGVFAGFVVRKKKVVQAAPVIKRLMGMDALEALLWLKTGGWRIRRLSPR